MSEDVALWAAMAVLALLIAGLPGWLLWTWLLFRTRGNLWQLAQLSGARAPYPRRPVWGLLRVTRDGIMWGGFWGAGGLDLGPAGLKALYPRPVTQRDRSNQSVALVCRDGLGTPVTLRVQAPFVERVMTVLADRPLPALPEPPVARRRRPTVTSLLPFVLIAPGVAVIAVGLAGGNGVTGSNSTVLAGTLLAVGVGTLALVLRARRRARPVPGAVTPRDRGRPGDASWQQLSATAAAVALAEDWETAPTLAPRGGSGPSVATSAGRWLVGRSLVDVARLVAGVLVTGFFLWPLLVPPWASYSTLWSDVGTTSRTDAWIVMTQGTLPLLPVGNVTVEVMNPEGAITIAVVPVTRLPGSDQGTLAIEYSVEAPERAWAVENDGRSLGAAVGGIALLLLVGSAASPTLGLTRAGLARRASLRHGAPHDLRYVAVLDEYGTYLLLLFDEDPTSLPRFAVAVPEAAVRDLPVAGLLEVRGDLTEGAMAVPVVQGRPLATTSPLVEVEPEKALELFQRPDDPSQSSPRRARHRDGDRRG